MRPSIAVDDVGRGSRRRRSSIWAAQLVGGLLELRHLVAAEGVGVGQRSPDGVVAAGRQVAEVAAVGGQQAGGLVVDDLLRRR